jgi:AcrR family transcriptional regulator
VSKSARRLAATVAHVPGTGRRAQYSASTRRALVDVAERLFAEQGYAATSLDAIVAGAEVTKGALYHHYSGKQALFEAVFEKVETAGARQIQEALQGHRDPWDKAIAGLRAFLAVVRQPAYSRIVVQDGPSVLGYERFREQEERSTFVYVLDIVRAVLGAGDWEADDAMEHTFARIFFGAMSSAGGTVSRADDADDEAERVETAIGFILAGLRALSEQGRELSGPPAASGPERAARPASGEPASRPTSRT